MRTELQTLFKGIFQPETMVMVFTHVHPCRFSGPFLNIFWHACFALENLLYWCSVVNVLFGVWVSGLLSGLLSGLVGGVVQYQRSERVAWCCSHSWWRVAYVTNDTLSMGCVDLMLWLQVWKSGYGWSDATWTKSRGSNGVDCLFNGRIFLFKVLVWCWCVCLNNYDKTWRNLRCWGLFSALIDNIPSELCSRCWFMSCPSVETCGWQKWHCAKPQTRRIGHVDQQ